MHGDTLVRKCFICATGTKPHHLCRRARHVDDSRRRHLLYEQYHDAHESGTTTHEIQRSGQLGVDWIRPRIVGGYGRAKLKEWQKYLWTGYMGEQHPTPQRYLLR